MVVIITDGYKNASREFGLNKVKQMIENQKEKYNWEFLFLGANIDAVQTAGTFGINADRAVTYQPDSVGTRTNFDAVSETVACMRAERLIDRSWKDRIENYMKKKQKLIIKNTGMSDCQKCFLNYCAYQRNEAVCIEKTPKMWYNISAIKTVGSNAYRSVGN